MNEAVVKDRAIIKENAMVFSNVIIKDCIKLIKTARVGLVSSYKKYILPNIIIEGDSQIESTIILEFKNQAKLKQNMV